MLSVHSSFRPERSVSSLHFCLSSMHCVLDISCDERLGGEGPVKFSKAYIFLASERINSRQCYYPSRRRSRTILRRFISVCHSNLIHSLKRNWVRPFKTSQKSFFWNPQKAWVSSPSCPFLWRRLSLCSLTMMLPSTPEKDLFSLTHPHRSFLCHLYCVHKTTFCLIIGSFWPWQSW